MKPRIGLAGGRCGVAGEFWEDADEPPLAASADMPLPPFMAVNDVVRERVGFRDWISNGEASKIVKPLVSNPGG